MQKNSDNATWRFNGPNVLGQKSLVRTKDDRAGLSAVYRIYRKRSLITNLKGMDMATLYEQLGGAQGISKIVDDIVEAHLNNPVIKARFTPYLDKPEKVAEIKKHNRDFLGAGSGGPEKYTGRSMLETHRGMNISEAEYVAVIDDILSVLERHGVAESARKDVLAITYGLKGEVIRQ